MKKSILFLLVLFACSQQTHVLKTEKVSGQAKAAVSMEKSVVLGVENFLMNHVDLVRGKRVGLVTNQSGVDSKLKSTIDLFYENPDINLTALYGPEHGIRGDVFAGHKVSDQTDPKTGLPVYSLYGKTRKPTEEMLANVDVIFFDIQDIGNRSYTYIGTMGLLIEAAAEFNKEVVILDRPNPMGGEAVEGNIVHEGYFSLVGYYPVAYRHGMTIGEIAKFHNSEKNLGAKLTVIPMLNWKREMLWQETGLPWVPTSPHVPYWNTVFYIMATGTFGELHTISEGVGYTSPFEFAAATWIDADNFAKALNKLNLPGVLFRPIHYKPYYFSFKDQEMKGVQLHITDYRTFKPFITGLHIMKTAMDLYPDQDIFAEGNRISSFNRVMGSDAITNALKNGASVKEIQQQWQDELNNFLKIRKQYLLY